MAVKIKRREEKRNTSRPQFILAAALPLLLFGWLGYSLGKAGKQDQAVNRAAIAKEQQRADQAESRLAAWISYMGSIDSLREVVQNDIKDRDAKLNTAFAEHASANVLSLDPIGDWTTESLGLSRDINNKLKIIETDAKGRTPEYELQVVQLSRLLGGLTEQSFKSLYNKADLMEKRLELGLDLQSDCDERIEDLEDKITDLEDDVDDAVDDKASLLERLQDCRSQIMAAAGGEPINHNAQKQAIEGALQRLSGFSNQLGGGFLNLNNNAKNKVQNTITTEVGIIRTSLSTIQ